MRYDSTPFITTIETTSYPIWNVPFPAVTVCNINKVYRPASENIRAKLYNDFRIKHLFLEYNFN